MKRMPDGRPRKRIRNRPSFQVGRAADVLERRVHRLKHSVNTRHEPFFCYPEVVRDLSSLHKNFVDELGLNSLPGSSAYNLTDFFLQRKC